MTGSIYHKVRVAYNQNKRCLFTPSILKKKGDMVYWQSISDEISDQNKWLHSYLDRSLIKQQKMT